jgi:hypothetical protein
VVTAKPCAAARESKNQSIGREVVSPVMRADQTAGAQRHQMTGLPARAIASVD